MPAFTILCPTCLALTLMAGFMERQIRRHCQGEIFTIFFKFSFFSGVEDTLGRRYLYSFYWSTLMLSNVCEVPWPVRSAEFMIVCGDLMFGVLIFATIVGNVGSMIANSGAARSQFQARIDNVKNFLKIRGVGKTVKIWKRNEIFFVLSLSIELPNGLTICGKTSRQWAKTMKCLKCCQPSCKQRLPCTCILKRWGKCDFFR